MTTPLPPALRGRLIELLATAIARELRQELTPVHHEVHAMNDSCVPPPPSDTRTLGERILLTKPRNLTLEDIQELPGLHAIREQDLPRLPGCFPLPIFSCRGACELRYWPRRAVLNWWKRSGHRVAGS